MIKYILIVFNSLILFLSGLFNADNGITITSKIPAVMFVGKEVPVELMVSKGSMSGFAKLQLELPGGFTVREADEKGATYTHNEGIAKWVWAILPSESEFTIKLVLVPGNESIGARTIRAKYSYVENNVKQVVEMLPADVQVSAGAPEDGSASAPIVTSESSAPSPSVMQQETEVPVLPPPVTSNSEKPGSIVLKRTIRSLSSTEFEVELQIAKGATKGFARYSDILPQDVVVKSAKTDGSSFSLADGKIKFVWVNVPEKDTLLVSYLISSKRIQAVELKGEYTYLEDNQSKKQEIDAHSLSFENPIGGEKQVASSDKKAAEPGVAKEKSEKKTLSKKPAEKKPVIAEPTEKVVKESKKSKVKSREKEEAGPVQPAIVQTEGTFYQVQIGAFNKSKVTTKKLEKRFNISEPINSEMASGFTKFMVGTHREYKEARDHREKVISDNKIKSSFVVAYNNGKRITVQEALSITNQKWYK